MRYRLFGRTGLRVSELALGTMTFGEEWGWGAPKDEARRIFDAYAEAGGNFIDTANRYTEGTSERWVGEFVAADRDRFVVATKYTLFDRKGDPNSAGSHRKNLVRSLEASLARLGLPTVDVLWVHAWDELTPVEEVLRGLDDVVRAGKALYVGVSDTPAWVVSRAQAIAELRGWTAFAGLQVEYSLARRDIERELLPMARAHGMAVTVWGALAGGVLTGKYRADRSAEDGAARYAGNAAAQRLGGRFLALGEAVRAVAAESGLSPAQVALAWVRAQDPAVLPIVGARRVEQVRDALGVTGRALAPEHVARLSAAAPVEPGFPADFLAQPNIRELVHAGMRDAIDAPR